MERENSKQDNLKIIFSLISLFLMIPPLTNGDKSYYRTLFIFLINRIIDMSFQQRSNETTFFAVWSLVNQWVGTVACAGAFCLLSPDFADFIKTFSNQINISLFVVAFSCVVKEMVILIGASVRESLIKEKLESDINGMKGE